MQPTTQTIKKFRPSDRRVIFLTSLIGFVSGYGASQMAHTLPYLRLFFEVTESEMDLIFTGIRGVSILGVLFAMSADRTGRRRPILAAFSLVIIGSLTTAFMPTLFIFIVSQGLVRISIVAIASLSLILIAEELPPGTRAFGIGIYGLAGSLGVGTGLLLLPIAGASDDAWRILFGITTLGSLLFPLLMHHLPESRAFTIAPTIKFTRALGMGLSKHFWPLAGTAFFVAAFSSPAFDFVLIRLISDLSWEPGAARFLLLVFSGLGTSGLIVGGKLADRVGRKPVTISALIFGLIGGVGFYFSDTGWLISASVFVATFGATMLTPSFGAQRAELFPTRVRAVVSGWITNSAIVGSISGFFAGGYLIERIGLPNTVAVLGAGILLSIYLITRVPETRGMDLYRRRTAPTGATTRT